MPYICGIEFSLNVNANINIMMKNLLKTAFVFFLLLVSCNSSKSLHTEMYKGQPILVGKAQRSDLEKVPYNEWFTPEYKAYQPNKNAINNLKNVINDYQITVVMGTWCGDSQEQVPDLYKVLDLSGYKHDITLFCVPRNYKEYEPSASYNLLRVPTIIVYKNGEEKGRIIEYPMQRIETDLLKIMTKQFYRHELLE